MAELPASREQMSGSVANSADAEDRLSRFDLLAVRGMAQRKARTGLTLLAIALGVAVILAVDITQATTLASIHNLFDEIAGRAHLIVQPSALGSKGFNEELLRDVADLEKVQAAAPVLEVQTSLVGQPVVRDSPFLAGPQGGVTLLGVDPLLESDAREYELAEGRSLGVNDDNEALIGSGLAQAQQLGVGDELRLVTSTGELALIVIGVVDTVGVGRVNEGNVVVAPLPVVQDAFQLSGQITRIDVVVDPALAGDTGSLDSFKTDLEAHLSSGVDVAYPAARGKLISQTLSAYQTGLDSFGVVAIFVGGFLIYNAFAMTIVERIREIGILRAIGSTRRQIVRLILGEAVIVGVSGALIGLAAGFVLAGALIRGMSTLLSTPLDAVSIPPGSLVRSFAIGLGVTLVAAFLPAWRGGQISPLRALHIRAQSDQRDMRSGLVWAPGIIVFAVSYLGTVFVEVLPGAMRVLANTVSVLGMFLGAALMVSPVVSMLGSTLRTWMIRVYGPAGWIGGSNVVRARSRSALTVAALMIGVAMVIAFGEEVNSIRADVLGWVDTALGGDVYVRSINPMPPAFGDELRQNSGVQAVSPATFTMTGLVSPNEEGESSPVSVRAIDPETYQGVGTFRFDDPSGDQASRLAELGEGDALFVATALADRHGIKRGDEIVIETDDGPGRFRVVGIIVDFYAQGNTITIGRGDLERYFGLSRVHMFSIVAAPRTDVAALTEELRSRYSDQEQVDVHSRTVLKERLNGLMDQQSALLYALVGIALVVAAIGVVNTLMMNIMERKREIGMLLSLGMTRRQIVKVVLAESASLGIVGTLLGLGLGLIVSRSLIRGANIVGGYRFGYTFTATPLVLGLVIGLLLSQLAGLYPAWRATQTNVVEAIKHE